MIAFLIVVPRQMPTSQRAARGLKAPLFRCSDTRQSEHVGLQRQGIRHNIKIMVLGSHQENERK
jgi:hypothetical protein